MEIRCYKHDNMSCSIGNCEQTCHICGKEYGDSEMLTASELLQSHLRLRHDRIVKIQRDQWKKVISIPAIHRDLPDEGSNKLYLREFVDILMSKDASEFDSGNVWFVLEVLLDKGIDPSYLKDTIDLMVNIKPEE